MVGRTRFRFGQPSENLTRHGRPGRQFELEGLNYEENDRRVSGRVPRR
jgi:hypothetical protein